MRIVLNGMFWREPNVGSGQYLHGLVRGLQRSAPEHELLLLLPRYREGDAPIPESSANLRFQVLPTPFDGRVENLAKLWFEQHAVPSAAARLKADLLHVPYAAPPLLSRVPVVTTIHDIIWHLLPEYHGGRAARAYFRMIPPAARRASAIITDSAYSRQDIISHFGIAAERVTSILLAPAESYRPLDRAEARRIVAERYGLHEPFIYYVGGLDARKNVATLIRAFGILRRAGGPAATLAIAGRALGGDPRLFPDLDAVIAEQQLGNAIRRIDVPREDGPLLYNAATVFAFPSRYEGFGLTPLEAMACGTPVIVADASSLPEVVGDAALRVAPDDIAGWAEALWLLLADADLNALQARRGLDHAAQFSYTRVAEETLRVYWQVAQKTL